MTREIPDAPQLIVLQFQDMHEKLTSSGDIGAARQRLVELAVEFIEPCDWAAITAWPERSLPRTLAHSGSVPLDVDHIQYAAGEGPCLTAATEDSPAWVPDLRAESRWLNFVSSALSATPVRSVLSYHLTDTPVRSALNLYAGAPGALDHDAVTASTLFASHAAVLMAHVGSTQEAETLGTALATSRRIGAAIGILMKTHGVTEDTAFAMLRATSNRLNRKIKDVAEDVKQAGQLPRR